MIRQVWLECGFRKEKGTMGRYTEYHDGKARIRNRALWPEAVNKLAKLEDMVDVREKKLFDVLAGRQ